MLRIILRFIGMLLMQPGWYLTFFLLLTCLVFFAGPTASISGQTQQTIEPFSFSMLIPSVDAFGPVDFLSLAQLLLITSAVIEFRRMRKTVENAACGGLLNSGTVGFTAVLFYILFLIFSLPLLARSNAFPGLPAIGLTFADLILKATALSFVLAFAMSRTENDRFQPLIIWIIAGAFHFALHATDIFLVPPEAQAFVATDITRIAWHFVIAIAAVTLHALPLHRRLNL
ncbi:MAG TPA: hypothetical protein ENN67_01235 [Firmicutes bacterium]|nr:hypothetical protein [Bacillota bacterium]